MATNVAARGLDISDVTHVINFDMPKDIDEGSDMEDGRECEIAGESNTVQQQLQMGRNAISESLELLQTPTPGVPSPLDVSTVFASPPRLSNGARPKSAAAVMAARQFSATACSLPGAQRPGTAVGPGNGGSKPPRRNNRRLKSAAAMHLAACSPVRSAGCVSGAYWM